MSVFPVFRIWSGWPYENNGLQISNECSIETYSRPIGNHAKALQFNALKCDTLTHRQKVLYFYTLKYYIRRIDCVCIPHQHHTPTPYLTNTQPSLMFHVKHLYYTKAPNFSYYFISLKYWSYAITLLYHAKILLCYHFTSLSH